MKSKISNHEAARLQLATACRQFIFFVLFTFWGFYGIIILGSYLLDKLEFSEGKEMLEIRYVQSEDKEFWYSLDRHLSEQEFNNKISDKRGYVLLDDNKPIGLLRYNLFWDNTPFCTMLFVDWNYHGKGYGKKLMEHWENDMKLQGYGMLLTSTQVDEEAQHFYRKLGYKDCGGLIIDILGYEQPMELFLIKAI